MAGVTLRRLSIADYVRDVMPETASLWAGRRDFPHLRRPNARESQRAATANATIERSDFSTDERMVASFKRYDRTAHLGRVRLRTCGIGAVFTPERYRGRGYASVMLAAALDAARDAGYDAAFLFSDIAPQFYAALGFVTLPSREIALRADALPRSACAPDTLHERDWTGVRRCYEIGERLRSAGFARTADVGIRALALAARSATGAGRSNRSRAAPRPRRRCLRAGRAHSRARHVRGRRIRMRRSGDARKRFRRCCAPAAGDLRRISGWLPPAGARELLPRGTDSQTQDAQLHGRRRFRRREDVSFRRTRRYGPRRPVLARRPRLSRLTCIRPEAAARACKQTDLQRRALDDRGDARAEQPHRRAFQPRAP